MSAADGPPAQQVMPGSEAGAVPAQQVMFAPTVEEKSCAPVGAPTLLDDEATNAPVKTELSTASNLSNAPSNNKITSKMSSGRIGKKKSVVYTLAAKPEESDLWLDARHLDGLWLGMHFPFICFGPYCGMVDGLDQNRYISIACMACFTNGAEGYMRESDRGWDSVDIPFNKDFYCTNCCGIGSSRYGCILKMNMCPSMWCPYSTTKWRGNVKIKSPWDIGDVYYVTPAVWGSVCGCCGNGGMI